MLKTALPTLESDLYNIIQEASYNAFMTTQIASSYASDSVSTRMDSELTQAATNFSVMFAETAAEPMADAIYRFVLEIGIVGTPSGSLISTSIKTPSPVTGSMPMSDFAIY